jgi:hypothetical protein
MCWVRAAPLCRRTLGGFNSAAFLPIGVEGVTLRGADTESARPGGSMPGSLTPLCGWCQCRHLLHLEPHLWRSA